MAVCWLLLEDGTPLLLEDGTPFGLESNDCTHDDEVHYGVDARVGARAGARPKVWSRHGARPRSTVAVHRE